ncbi:GAF domain-containing SpoIIE family protein phosphatase [Paramaledivibacter caminithermalis]|uniref:Serine phosphatase RsbU, regulator of sigma subunit n=1 Tax=Paramaledivibacter caminithermalis (strain DSM 15212 / CIP 107654 / DViRD3) TaxID=1121301 RepID=A0A1M6P8V8_PARC5|nr:SpoIIE family protein phosphatase [Paramaledivibacter caminithermalis]SHK04357.1 Serine phosphatase RsbU, regulator of sigma subunit [Paramaledivibacter caminithermalis DSM 15212]
MNNREKIYLLEENEKLHQKLKKMSLQNDALLMLTDFTSTLLVTTDLEKVSYIIIEHAKKLMNGKNIKFIRKEPEIDTYAYYKMENNYIKKKILKRNQLGKECFFIYCNKFYISSKDKAFIAVPIKYEGENIGVIIVEGFDSGKIENKNIKLMDICSKICGIVIKNCLLMAQYENEKKIISEQNKKMSEDLKYAQKIQEYLLPRGKQHFGRYSLYCNHIQAQYLGGDFYDVFQYSYNKIIFYIADISGHGVSSALLTLFLKQAVRGIAKTFKNDYVYPSKILEKLHHRFNDFMVEEELYIGILIGVLDIEKNEVIISNGGHNVEPIHLKTEKKQVVSYDFEGLPISNWFKDLQFSYEDNKIYLDINDKLILLTDGATESRLNENELLGIKGIKEILFKNINLDCDKKFNELLKYTADSTKIYNVNDDIAFLCLKRED